VYISIYTGLGDQIVEGRVTPWKVVINKNPVQIYKATTFSCGFKTLKVCEDKIMHNEAKGKIKDDILLDLADKVGKIETE